MCIEALDRIHGFEDLAGRKHYVHLDSFIGKICACILVRREHAQKVIGLFHISVGIAYRRDLLTALLYLSSALRKW